MNNTSYNENENLSLFEVSVASVVFVFGVSLVMFVMSVFIQGQYFVFNYFGLSKNVSWVLHHFTICVLVILVYMNLHRFSGKRVSNDKLTAFSEDGDYIDKDFVIFSFMFLLSLSLIMIVISLTYYWGSSDPILIYVLLGLFGSFIFLGLSNLFICCVYKKSGIIIDEDGGVFKYVENGIIKEEVSLTKIRGLKITDADNLEVTYKINPEPLGRYGTTYRNRIQFNSIENRNNVKKTLNKYKMLYDL